MTKIMLMPRDTAPIAHALDLILEKLSEFLELSDKAYDSMDRPEEVERDYHFLREIQKKNDPAENPEATPEELDSWLQDKRDRSTRSLGHMGKRIAEIKSLQESINAGNPSDDEVERICYAIRNTIIMEALDLDWQMQVGESSQVKRTLERLCLHSKVLSEGFCIFEVMSLEYPYDDFKEEAGEDPSRLDL